MTDVGQGEVLERQRRKRFWGIVAFLVGLGALTGFFGGVYVGMNDAPGQPFVFPPLLAWGGVIAAALAFLYGTWAYFRAVDEVDLVDNLWGSTVGFYAYATLFGGWMALSLLEAAPAPNHVTIFLASLVAATVAYLYRKWRAR